MPICKICGKEFEYKNYVVTECCSRSCAAKARHQKLYTKNCEFPGCSNVFQGDVNTKYCKGPHYLPCPVCGKPVISKDNSTVPICCSTTCKKIKETSTKREKYTVPPSMTESAKMKRKQTMVNRYGAEYTYESAELAEKAKATMVENYGVEYTLQSGSLSEKVRSTNLKKYGYPIATQSKIIKDKIKDTNLTRYGANNPMQVSSIKKCALDRRIEKYGAHITDEMKQKAKETWMKHLYVDNPAKSVEVRKRMINTWKSNLSKDNPMKSKDIKEKVIQTNMERYHVPYYVMTDDCMSRNGLRISQHNLLFSDMLNAMNIDHELEFAIDRKQYDVVVQSSKIVIEIDPTYTHNSFGNHWNTDGLAKTYHIEKSDLARSKGYRCIHIFDWDDQSKIAESLQQKQKIYARNCKVVKFTEVEVKSFLDKYHLQGTCRGQSVILGLVYLDKLVQVMTFGKPRYSKKYEWELLRLCSAANVNIIGGSSRLFSHFVAEQHPVSIISYCDLSKFNGDVYERLGMRLIRVTPPQEIWSKGKKKITANLLRQRGYDQLFNTQYGKGTCNEALMINDGWLPVYDCGQAVYEYK